MIYQLESGLDDYNVWYEPSWSEHAEKSSSVLSFSFSFKTANFLSFYLEKIMDVGSNFHQGDVKSDISKM